MYAIGQSSRVWGDSHAFVPERFLGAQEATSIGTHIKSKASDLWIPFSVGSRRCPAVNFAMTEQRTLLALLLLHYEWMLPEHSIHGGLDGIHNAPSAFALNLPLDVDLDFTPCAPSA
jgi:cytochrome P450